MSSQNIYNHLLDPYKVRVTENTSSEQLQHVRLDIGSGSTESQVSSANPLPVSGTITTNDPELTANAPAAASVGVASAEVVASNVDRTGLILTNTSSNNISLGFGTAAVLNSGITLTPNGTFNMDAYSFTTQAVNAIASGAGSNLALQEFE